jgi:ComF family protein
MLVAQTCFRAGEHDLVVPVPLHRDRLRWRGFNHSCLLAAPLARRLSLPLAPTVVCRKRATQPQVSLPETRRLSNVRGAFGVPDHRRVAGRRILLVDDVYTTGATVAACATALDRAGAAVIDVLTLARAVP